MGMGSGNPFLKIIFLSRLKYMLLPELYLWMLNALSPIVFNFLC